MKACLFMLILFCEMKAYALGDTGVLPDTPEAMTGTVRALNQVSDTEEGQKLNQQDMQEKIYQDDQQREQEQWELEKKRQDARASKNGTLKDID